MSKIHVVGSLGKPKPGNEEAFQALMRVWIERVQLNDPGTVSFGFFLDEATGAYAAIETYESSEAMLGHRANVDPLDAELYELIDLEGDPGEPLKVYGDPSAEVRSIYKEFGAVFYPTFGGF